MISSAWSSVVYTLGVGVGNIKWPLNMGIENISNKSKYTQGRERESSQKQYVTSIGGMNQYPAQGSLSSQFSNSTSVLAGSGQERIAARSHTSIARISHSSRQVSKGGSSPTGDTCTGHKNPRPLSTSYTNSGRGWWEKQRHRKAARWLAQKSDLKLKL